MNEANVEHKLWNLVEIPNCVDSDLKKKNILRREIKII